MKNKIVVSTVAAFLVGFFLLAPSDFISQLVCGLLVALLCGVPLALLGRLAFVKSASGPVHTLVCVLVCLVVILSLECFLLARAVAGQQRRPYREAGSLDSSVRVENASHDVSAL